MVTAVTIVLIAMAVIAGLVPAHRAGTVDPVAILREG
jgi:ABC-type lipoprotein release transport system permease subunit